jgi:peptidyl-prolyl cis-trans isomerase C
VVAEVNGRPITAGEVYQKIRTQYPMMPQRGPGLGAQAKEVIKQMVTERCFADFAEARGHDRDPDYLRSIHFARLTLLAQIATRNEIKNPSMPSAATVDSFYQANLDRFAIRPQVWWRHIQVGREAEARRLLARAREGADFAALARDHSGDPTSAAKGGEMPPHPRGPQVSPLGNVPQLDEALFALKAGEVGGPVRSPAGWHVIKVDALREGRQRALDEVAAEIVAKIGSQRESARYQAVLDSLRRAYRASTDADALDRFHWLQMTDEELFQGAQRETDPARQVRMFQDLVRRYPEVPRAASAQFMVGFLQKEKLGDLDGARQSLERFLSEHPDHAMAGSARVLLEELKRGVGATGQTPPEAGPGTTR